MNPYRLRAYIQLLIVAVIWGIAGPVIKFSLEGFPPLILLTYRFAISTAVMAISSLIFGLKLPKDPKIFWLLILYAFLTSTVGLGFLFFGFEKTTAIDGTLISAAAPILVATAGAIFLKEHITTREKIGISIAFAGTALTIFEPILRSGAGFSGVSGNLLVFISLLVGVATAVIAKLILRDNVEPLTATNISFLVGFVTILPVTLLFYPLPNILNTIYNTPISYHLGVLFMALLSGNLAYWLWHKAQKTIEIGEAGLFAYLYPVFATPLAVFWLHEKITPPLIIGGLIIILGVIIAEYKKTRYNRI